MSEFINTLDVVGDEALFADIVCKTVTEISDNVLKVLGPYSLYRCTGLERVDFPAVEAVEASVFDGCTVLTTVNLPKATSVGDKAFQKLTALETVTAPELTQVGKYSFSSCSGLLQADFPKLTSIAERGFENCTQLTQVNFPLMTTLGGVAFGGCTSLKRAEFSVLTTINWSAFASCPLEVFINRDTSGVCALTVSAFGSTPIESGTGYIYVPAALVDQYKADTNWSTYADQIRAIEDYPDITGG